MGRFWATGLDNMEAAARELLATDPEVIVAQEFTVLAFRSVKTAKPVVFGYSGDPLDVKLVESWARPGGNFTGMSYLAIELVGKRIGLLKEWLPQTRRIAVLARPQHPGADLERKASEEAAAKLGIELSFFPYTSRSVLPARDLGELEAALRAVAQDRSDAMVVFPDSAMYEISDHIARFALEAKLPSVSGWSSFANKGLLMTYGPNVRELYRSLAGYVDKILRGTPPAVPGAHNIVLGDQSENCQGARVGRPSNAACPRRRGDRVAQVHRNAAPAQVSSWHFDRAQLGLAERCEAALSPKKPHLPSLLCCCAGQQSTALIRVRMPLI
jgi:hypothetical protein